MTPADLLAATRDMLQRQAPTAIGGWPRAVALLTRQALEKAMEELWKASPTTVGLCSCTMRTQLICLPTYLDHSLSGDVNYVWAALSSACHYHPYDLTRPVSDGQAPVTGHVGQS